MIIKEASFLPIVFPVPDVPTITVDESSLKIFDVSSKQIYRQFQAKKQEVPTAQKKLSDKYPHSAVSAGEGERGRGGEGEREGGREGGREVEREREREREKKKGFRSNCLDVWVLKTAYKHSNNSMAQKIVSHYLSL